MAACETLQLGFTVSNKYKACKQEFNFEKGSDDIFVDFLLDVSVKVIDMMKHITPVISPVLETSSLPLTSPSQTSHDERSNQQVAGERSNQQVAGERSNQQVAGERSNQQVAGGLNTPDIPRLVEEEIVVNSSQQIINSNQKIINSHMHLSKVRAISSNLQTSESKIVSSEQHISESKVHSNDQMINNHSIHRPLFQAATESAPKTPKNFIKKLPNFVKPTISKDQLITRDNFLNFKCNPSALGHALSSSYNSPTDSKPTDSRLSDSRLGDSRPSDYRPSDFRPSDSRPLVSPSTDSTSPKTPTSATVEHLTTEIAQFEKEIGSVLESLTQSSSECGETAVKRLHSEGNRSLSMVGMVKMEGSERTVHPNGYDLKSKMCHTRLNSRYKKYPDEMLKKAMYSVQTGQRTVAQAAKEFNIPRQTLQYRLFKRKRKFHVFAPNIPYTNNFFIENFNNAAPSSPEIEILRNIRLEKAIIDRNCDVTSNNDVTMPDSSFSDLTEDDLRLSLERTVEELLSSDNNFQKKPDVSESIDCEEESSDVNTSEVNALSVIAPLFTSPLPALTSPSPVLNPPEAMDVSQAND